MGTRVNQEAQQELPLRWLENRLVSENKCSCHTKQGKRHISFQCHEYSQNSVQSHPNAFQWIALTGLSQNHDKREKGEENALARISSVPSRKKYTVLMHSHSVLRAQMNGRHKPPEESIQKRIQRVRLLKTEKGKARLPWAVSPNGNTGKIEWTVGKESQQITVNFLL